ncbi:DUF2567 domain-containing protein [Gordonia sp. PS3]|uniref:DUF2567 domain-containing protein n=1 Tax=Gordonia TaxID=2053 RepID=UPI0005F06296|nr:DUF2567 domain-containing protein [Gordonia sihwensis]KJR04939.1 hypothetical protein UG54_17985 [Gordonia sihwensis]MBY4571407.1 hypothetical protein [Gordonia sihwensis]WFN91331.1 DUF2567 domain-containing protein [Gordonia sihwensis]
MNARRVVAVVLALFAAAVAVGGLWVLLAPAPDVVVEHGGQMRFATEADPAKLFDGVAIFSFLCLGLGVLIGLATWFGLRTSRGIGGFAFVVLMSIATSALALNLADRFGRMSHGEIERSVPGSYSGTVNLWLDGDVGPAWVLLLCAPTAGALVYLVCVLSSAHADLGVGDLPADEFGEMREPLPIGAVGLSDGGEVVPPSQPGDPSGR